MRKKLGELAAQIRFQTDFYSTADVFKALPELAKEIPFNSADPSSFVDAVLLLIQELLIELSKARDALAFPMHQALWQKFWRPILFIWLRAHVNRIWHVMPFSLTVDLKTIGLGDYVVVTATNPSAPLGTLASEASRRKFLQVLRQEITPLLINAFQPSGWDQLNFE